MEIYPDHVTYASQFEELIGIGPVLHNERDSSHLEFSLSSLKEGQISNISEHPTPSNIKK